MNRTPSLKRGGGHSTKDQHGKKTGYVRGEHFVERPPVSPLHATFLQFAELFKPPARRHRGKSGNAWTAGRLPYIDTMCERTGITRDQFYSMASKDRVTRPFTIFLCALACRRKAHHHPDNLVEDYPDPEERRAKMAERQNADAKALVVERALVAELRRQLPTRRSVVKLMAQIGERTAHLGQVQDRLIYLLSLFADAHWPEVSPIPLRILPMVDDLDPDIVRALIQRAHLVQGDELAALAIKEGYWDAWLQQRDMERLRKLKMKGGEGDGTNQGV